MEHGDIIDIIQNAALIFVALWVATHHRSLRHLREVVLASKEAELARVLAENQELKRCFDALQNIYREKESPEGEGEGDEDGGEDLTRGRGDARAGARPDSGDGPE